MMLKKRLSRTAAMAASVTLLLAAVGAMAHTTDWPAKRLAKLYPGAESYKQVRKPMTSEKKKRIKNAVGKQFNSADESPSFYVPIGVKSNGKKGSLALIYILDAKGENGPIEMGITVSLQGKVIRVVLFENKEPRAVNAEPFLGQFEGMTVGPVSYRSPEQLKEAPPDGGTAGQFIVGHDIDAPEGAEASAQAIATAVKKGLLMMKELF